MNQIISKIVVPGRLWRRGLAFTTILMMPLAAAEWVWAESGSGAPQATGPERVLIGIGDSLSHGTLDATNNSINTLNSFLQKVAESLGQVAPGSFSQPLFDLNGNRIMPLRIPTNLAVDGADIFSIEGIEYYKRAGATESVVTPDYLSDRLLPEFLRDKYDKVLYPINVLAGRPVSQIGAANWILDQVAMAGGKALLIFWVGNNDSSTAALGFGGKNPTFLPLPLEEIGSEIKPGLLLLLRQGEAAGVVSFDSYERAAIDRHLTDLTDFSIQFNRTLTRLHTGNLADSSQVEIILLTLPYYSAIGYLFDSDDLEFYLRKLEPGYSVPPSFKRVTPENPLSGDRVALLTFGLMYGLLETGLPVDFVNRVLETEGVQRDGLVLSEEEQQIIVFRIDQFNRVIRRAAARWPNTHLIDVGSLLNLGLGGQIEIKVGDRQLTRKWIRGNSFSFDGVHPNYTGHGLIANFILARLNEIFGFQAPLYDLEQILERDPYIDKDGDGWAPGPDYPATGINQLLFFFKDPDDADSLAQPELPADFWDQVSDIILGEILGVAQLETEAERLGLQR